MLPNSGTVTRNESVPIDRLQLGEAAELTEYSSFAAGRCRLRGVGILQVDADDAEVDQRGLLCSH